MVNDDAAARSPLFSLLSQIEQGIHARRRDVLGRLEPLEAALGRYTRAVEELAAFDYASSHGLKLPRPLGPSVAQAARTLLDAVLALPELERERQADSLGPGSVSRVAEVPVVSPTATSPQEAEASTAGASGRPLAAVLPWVAAACASRKLLIVGSLAGRRKTLPAPLDEATEWIDTADGSGRTVNLPTRIKQGGVFALVICDQAVSHQHSEPAVAAARLAGIPIGFAGKGGAGSIARALEAIEGQLEERSPKRQ